MIRCSVRQSFCTVAQGEHERSSVIGEMGNGDSL